MVEKIYAELHVFTRQEVEEILKTKMGEIMPYAMESGKLDVEFVIDTIGVIDTLIEVRMVRLIEKVRDE